RRAGGGGHRRPGGGVLRDGVGRAGPRSAAALDLRGRDPALAGARAGPARGDAGVVPHADRAAPRARGPARPFARGDLGRGPRGGDGAAAPRRAGRVRPSRSRPVRGGAARRGGARLLRRGVATPRRGARPGRGGSRRAPARPRALSPAHPRTRAATAAAPADGPGRAQEAASAAPVRSSAPPSSVREARRDRARRYFLRYQPRSSLSEKRSARTPGTAPPSREASTGTSRS